MHHPTILGTALALVAAASCRDRSAAPAAGRAEFVGSAKCATCHAPEAAAWAQSQHAVAMQDATPSTILGKFDSTRFTNAGVTYTFLRRGDSSIVRTAGANGAPTDYAIRYTFGVWPLQQYLVQLSGGHVQALLTAWDARPASAGGQRWFSLSPGAEASHTDR